MIAEDAMLEYLKVAQNLEMYGVTYFPVVNDKGSDVLLGVDALGISFYDKDDKFNPKVNFPWSEIHKLNYTKQKFKIKFNDKASKATKMKGKEPDEPQSIFHLATGNNDMYKRRRMPDPLEVQQMKGQREAERAARERERERLRREILARERLQKEQEEMEEKYRALQEEAEARRRELEEAREAIRRLEALLAETQVWEILLRASHNVIGNFRLHERIWNGNSLNFARPWRGWSTTEKWRRKKGPGWWKRWRSVGEKWRRLARL